MPAYNFQSQFVPMILDGSKIHTIRKRRRHPTKEGDLLWLYTGMRTKKCRLIIDTNCKKIAPIVIYPDLGQVRLEGRLLPLNEMMHFAVRDGFANYMEFFAFFRRYPQEVLEREMEVIYWR